MNKELQLLKRECADILTRLEMLEAQCRDTVKFNRVLAGGYFRISAEGVTYLKTNKASGVTAKGTLVHRAGCDFVYPATRKDFIKELELQ
jgi:hypothetical protein